MLMGELEEVDAIEDALNWSRTETVGRPGTGVVDSEMSTRVGTAGNGGISGLEKRRVEVEEMEPVRLREAGVVAVGVSVDWL